ncbi:MAG: S8 family serine peptidase [Deltaproteobacteria bacterium]|nr:S8 family serine peptidase [Deltaproteobacteria bacterium]
MQQHSSSSTGAGVRVALIDSGINPRHPHVGTVAGGIAFSLAADGTLHRSEDYLDRRGHGTALAGIVRAKAPQVELYAVKIFRDPLTPNDPLTTSFAVLEAGLCWALDQGMQIVNLSLGTTNPAHRPRLQALVAQAHAAGVLLVSSAPPGQTEILPAALPGVIGVAGDEACRWHEHRYVEEDEIHFRAHPQPRPIPGLLQERNFRGHSCASAHLAAVLALYTEQCSGLSVHEAQVYLKRTATPSAAD